jgi:osmoprotectant transport system permease protein
MKNFLRQLEIDRVSFVSAAAGNLFLLLNFLVFRTNRLASGTPFYAWQALPVSYFIFLACLWCLSLLLSLGGKEEKITTTKGILGNVILVSIFLLVSTSAGKMLTEANPFARISPGAGAWLMATAAYILILSSLDRNPGRLAGLFISLSGFTALTVLLFTGAFDALSIMKEYRVRENRFLSEFFNHLFLSGSAVSIATFIGIPLGVTAFRRKFFEKPIFLAVNTMQTIPSLALFGILIAPLSLLSQKFLFLRELGIKGIGWAPALIALTLYALLPIVRNAHTSLRIIDPAVVEAGKGMGMSRIQRLLQIEIPLALPVVLSGIRTALVQGIGNTTVAALIGAGGLGVFVFQGIGQAAPDLILLGAMPVIILAVVIDKIMQIFIWVATAKGLKVETT